MGQLTRLTSSVQLVRGSKPLRWSEALAAIRAGKAYANVHSTKWPGGEIRGQLNDPNGK